MKRENIKQLSRNEARLLIALLACDGTDGQVGDMPTVREWAGLSARAWEKAMQRLIDLGFIELREDEHLFIFGRRVRSPKANQERKEG